RVYDSILERPVQTRFRCGSMTSSLNLACNRNSPVHSAIGTPSRIKALRLLVSTRFQVLFHSPSGVLFTFPSRYWFTIGHSGVFSLERWSSQIPTEFLVFRRTQDPLRRKFPFDYRAVTFFGWSFQTIHLRNFLITPDGVSYNPRRQAFWFRLIPFRSPLLGKSRLLSLPPGTEMFQFPGCTLYTLCIQVYIRLHYET